MATRMPRTQGLSGFPEPWFPNLSHRVRLRRGLCSGSGANSTPPDFCWALDGRFSRGGGARAGAEPRAERRGPRPGRASALCLLLVLLLLSTYLIMIIICIIIIIIIMIITYCSAPGRRARRPRRPCPSPRSPAPPSRTYSPRPAFPRESAQHAARQVVTAERLVDGVFGSGSCLKIACVSRVQPVSLPIHHATTRTAESSDV